MDHFRVLGSLFGSALVIASLGCDKNGAASRASEPEASEPEASVRGETSKETPPDSLDLRTLHAACVAAFNAHDAGSTKNCYAPEATHEWVQSGLEPSSGPAAIAASLSALWTSSSDMRWEPQLVAISGNTVTSISVIHGSHDGDWKLPGAGSVAATGNEFGTMGIDIAEFDNAGKIVSHKVYWDFGVQMKQLSGAANARPPMKPWTAAPEVVMTSDDEREKANIATMTKHFEAFVGGDDETLHALEANDISVVDQAAPRTLIGIDERKVQVQGYRIAFPDLSGTITKQWAAGDYVFRELTLTGTNTGPLRGTGPVTGKSVRLDVVEARKLRAGQVSHQWLVFNSLSMASQLGLLPPNKK